MDKISLVASMITGGRSTRLFRLVVAFVVIGTLYLMYTSVHQNHFRQTSNRMSGSKTRLTWKSLEAGRRESLSLSEYEIPKGNTEDMYGTPGTAPSTEITRSAWVQSQITDKIYWLDNITVHRFPPPVPIKCNTENKLSELLSMDPIKFLPDYKNPCWVEFIDKPFKKMYRTNGFLHYSASYKNVFKKLRGIYKYHKSSPFESIPTRLRCLPYFFITGQPKCGSTDLYNKLASHPHIATPPTKESHWWGKNRYGWCLNYTRSIPFNDYVDLYDHPSIEIQSITENDPKGDREYHPVITGDASVSTLWSNDDWWSNPENCGLTEPLYTNAHYMHRLLPESRIIVILRNPTDRLYSDYLYFRDYKSKENFHQVVDGAIKSLNKCFETMGIRPCVYNASLSYGSRLRIRIGLYYVFLQEWLSVFPREQLMVVRLEDYASRPLETMKQVHKFLGLKQLTEEEHQEVMNQPKANTRRVRDKRLGSMMNETRQMLDNFYRPFNIKLARLLNDPNYLWDG